MKFLTVICVAGILFMGGMITGFQYSQIHWQNIDMDTLVDSKTETSQQTVKSEKEQTDLSKDLLKRQDQMKQEDVVNIFSNIGDTLDIFESTS
ncbi:hypothetical protein J2S78_002187 [Salibacterium salarium]|uniref:hypothetical protein n=1 Tax=Salibacterium salarium TaxID=284579 RepID=UPI002788BDDB|nr:hypothetical protein [Salibacterium salarium]MDQ0299767.1 hypothetical protein [Salibacterium salarium]